MGILSINEKTDTLVYIKDLYEVSVGVSRGRLNWDAVSDGGTIDTIMARYIGSQLVAGTEQEVIERALYKCGTKYFKQKYDNGLTKIFSVRWEGSGQYTVARLVDNQLNSHIKLILKKKNYGILQRFIQFFK